MELICFAKKMKKTMKILRKIATGFFVLVFAAAMSGLIMVKDASAVMSAKSDTMSRLQDNTASNHTIEFTTSVGVTAGQTITVTFPAGFTIGSVDYEDIDLADDETDLALAAAASGATWGASFTGQVLTITSDSGTIAGGSTVTIEIGTNATYGSTGASQITNPDISSDTTYEIAIGGTMSDSGQVEVQILMDDTVTVSATVDESIAFDVSTGDDWEIGFGDLTSANARYATASGAGDTTPQVAHSMTAATNASGGYVITVSGATLTSESNGSDTIDAIGGTHAASNPGTEQFGIRLSATDGIGAATDPYNDASEFAYDGATAPDQVASAAGPSATTTYGVYYLANILATTESGTYTTDLTYIATATF